MKKVLFFLLVTCMVNFSYSQCHLLNVSPDSAKSFIPLMEKEFDVKLMKGRSIEGKRYTWKDSSNYVTLIIDVEKEKTMKGVTVVEGEEKVSYISIGAPLNLLEPFMLKLKELLTPCGIKNSGKLYIKTKEFTAVLNEDKLTGFISFNASLP